MSTSLVPDSIIDRLRANLRAAGIAATDDDIQGIIEQGFLNRQVTFDALIARLASDTLPDYLSPEDVEITKPPDVLTHSKGTVGHVAAKGLKNAPREFVSIGAVAEFIQSRQVSSVELTEQALERIAQFDPQLNAFQIVLDERSRQAAQRADAEIAAGNYRGPLHGVPVAVKDLMMMRGTVTTAGSKILAGWSPDVDAAVVERLEAAGAVIVGKTRLSEFAYSPGSNNAHYGPTRNPWNTTRDTGGSSSGSAAAVAAGLVYGALGSDTGGSIRIPASLCGIVGLKPTFGRVSLYGAMPLSWSLDHIGPLTRTVADAAILLDVLAGHDPRDPRTRKIAQQSFAAHLDNGVAGMRIGVLNDDGTGKPLGATETLEAWRAGLAALEQQGATLVEIDLPEMEDLRTVSSAVLALEAAAYHLPMLRERLDDFGEFMRRRILGSFAYGPAALVAAQQARAQLRRQLLQLFNQVDVISTPTQPDAAPSLNTIGWTLFTNPFNLLGWPAISIPCGLTTDGMPLGLQLVGTPWDEATVLRGARVVEAAINIGHPGEK